MSSQKDIDPIIRLYREPGVHGGSFEFSNGNELGMEVYDNDRTMLYWSADELGREAAIKAIAPLVEEGDRILIQQEPSPEHYHEVRLRMPRVLTAARLSRANGLLFSLDKKDSSQILWREHSHPSNLPQITILSGSILAAKEIMQQIGIGQKTVGSRVLELADAITHQDISN